jgi:hypothetical protein
MKRVSRRDCLARVLCSQTGVQKCGPAKEQSRDQCTRKTHWSEYLRCKQFLFWQLAENLSQRGCVCRRHDAIRCRFSVLTATNKLENASDVGGLEGIVGPDLGRLDRKGLEHHLANVLQRCGFFLCHLG